MSSPSLTFHGSLAELLSPRWRGNRTIKHALDRTASIKDVVESFGVPHTEIERLTVQGKDVHFGHLVHSSDTIDVYPAMPPVDVFSPTLLRPRALEKISFVVDINVGKLARILRLLGFDTAFVENAGDKDLAEISEQKGRILLTRDGNLLKRKNVMHGRLVRSSLPKDQAVEIIRWYGLEKKVKPFSRCLACNGMLAPIEKEKIIHRLEPLTKKYFFSFYICEKCEKIYWPGSHRDRMQAFLDELRETFAMGNR